MLRFESLSQVFNKFGANNFSADFAITDYPVSNIGSSSSRYIANLIPDSFSETISQKIGAIVVNYKTPLTFRSNVDKSNNASSLIKPDVNTVDAPHSVWTMKEADGLSQFFINDTLTATDKTLNLSVGQIDVNAVDQTTSINTEGSFVGSRRTPAKMSGDLLVGSEIIGYSGMEYSFSDPSNTRNKITRTIYDYSDLQSAISDFQIYNTGSSFASTSSVQFEPTGKLMNLVRGKYGTPINEQYNHSKYSSPESTPFKFFSASAPSNFINSLRVFGGLNDVGSDYQKISGVLKISNANQDRYTIAQAPTTQGDYNFYSLSFSVDDGDLVRVAESYRNKEGKPKTPAQYAGLTATEKKKWTPNLVLSPNNCSFGFIFNTSQTPGDTTSAFCIEIQQRVGKDKNQTITNKLIAYRLSDPTNLIIDNPISCKDIFNGQAHGLNLYFLGTGIVTVIDGVSTTHSPISGKSIPSRTSSLYFGTYIQPLEPKTQKLVIYELYSAKYDGEKLTSKNNRHFTSQQYLDDLINKTHTTYNYFHYSSPPLARGINFYDVKLESAPVFTKKDKTVSIQKVSYKNPGSDWTMLQPVNAEDISYSSLKGTAFQQRFAIAHDGPAGQGLIILNTGGAKSGDISQSLTLLGNNMYLSEQKTLKRVIDKNYANNTISLTVDWARDITAVEKIISNIVRANSSFNLDYNIRVFGNPLIQAGDFGQITYKLKGLGTDKPLVGLITSVRNTYRDGLDNTELTFKPMIIS
jgi:hypothetical protein